MTNYDISVIGGGPGGYVAAIKAAQMGAKTAIIEDGNIGGVCLNWGCIPTKTLLKSAKVYKYMMNSEKYGIDLENKSNVKINWENMKDRKNKVVSQLTGGVETLLKKNSVDIYNGFANIIDKNTIEVNNEKINTKNIIIATGSSPRLPDIPGFKESMEKGYIVTSKGVIDLDNLPKKLLILGGGVISVEFATLYNALGTEVTILHRSEKILRSLDDDISKKMNRILKKDGVKIVYNCDIQKIEDNKIMTIVKGKEKVFEGDKILTSIGRVPNLKGLENIDIKKYKKGIITDEYMRTNIDNIYAIGDVNGKYMLAHVASAEGISAVENILGEKSTINYNTVPSCIYSFPEIGVSGLTEKEAKEKGYDVITSTFPLAANGKALAEGETDGFIKIVSDDKYKEILGVHILAPTATDMIAEAVTTMELEGTAYELAKAIHPHPTLSETVMEAAHGIIDKPIHIFR
ncbi:dihydrolipoyl dehydrogenase [Senegalia massiliensis]|uniref:Dihydrolipoyl dehydrogenase n=1 Tax=Senegalia massiliensis TaxID=1720316 RepID=A0A845QYC0_9CLOT|nr:dihydrolipoyl dehydrogenase [Senegalia massiliensis]NBI05383.1 dihydrolipoyl dehydrogenase [Senegalia massiliensis]